ncbi:MAG TPA: histidine kinase N-terminal 7TM domain-containing protein, partial [Chloroflexota bacterium]
MSQQTVLLIMLLFASASVTGVIAAHSWRRRRIPGAAPFAVACLFAALWPVGEAFQLSSRSLPVALFWLDVQYFSLAAIPVAWAAMSLQYVTGGKWLTPRGLLLISIIPAVTVLMVWTNDLHGLMWTRAQLDLSGPTPIIHKSWGPWFWVNGMYTYLLLLGSGALLTWTMMRSPGQFRGQPLSLLAGLAVPLIANVHYITVLAPKNQPDPTPILVGVGAAICTWGLFRYGLFVVVPVAHSKVIEAMMDGVVVTDSLDHIVEINPAAEAILGANRRAVIGSSVSSAFNAWPALIGLYGKASDPYTVLV